MKSHDGQKLRCVYSPNRHIVRGHFYEVAEILEMPRHAMVRKPDGKWPKPGEPYFGWHPEEFFEGSSRGIPALSCGYDYVDIEFFGAIIPDSIFPTPPVPFSGRASVRCERISNIVDAIGVPSIWWRTFNHILPNDYVPESVERKFMMLGIDYQHIRRRTTFKTLAIGMRSIMRKLGIASKSMPIVEDQQIEFWRRSWRKAGSLTWKTWLRE